MAQVLPLPLVPPTVTTGQSKEEARCARTARTRSSPSAIVLGWSVSRYWSQPASVAGRSAGGVGVKALWGRLPREQCEQARELVAKLAAVDDEVERPLLQQEFRALES